MPGVILFLLKDGVREASKVEGERKSRAWAEGRGWENDNDRWTRNARHTRACPIGNMFNRRVEERERGW